MKQRSEEWFDARKGRITASLVGAILSNSPHMTREDAMRVMVREALGEEREFKGNVATDYGTNNEPGALLEYRLETGANVQEVGFLTREDWAGCSPDGLIGDDSGLEIKCPYSLRKTEAPVSFKTLADQPHYYDQVQFSMWVADRQSWDFYQWAPNGTCKTLTVQDKGWQDENLPKLRQFHAEFLHELKNNADEYRKPKRQVIDTPEAHRAMDEWDAINEQLEQLAERKRDLLDAITSMGDGRDLLFAGRKVTKVERKGSVAFARVVKDHCESVDLEPYRGKASTSWRVS